MDRRDRSNHESSTYDQYQYSRQDAKRYCGPPRYGRTIETPAYGTRPLSPMQRNQRSPYDHRRRSRSPDPGMDHSTYRSRSRSPVPRRSYNDGTRRAPSPYRTSRHLSRSPERHSVARDYRGDSSWDAHGNRSSLPRGPRHRYAATEEVHGASLNGVGGQYHRKDISDHAKIIEAQRSRSKERRRIQENSRDSGLLDVKSSTSRVGPKDTPDKRQHPQSSQSYSIDRTDGPRVPSRSQYSPSRLTNSRDSSPQARSQISAAMKHDPDRKQQEHGRPIETDVMQLKRRNFEDAPASSQPSQIRVPPTGPSRDRSASSQTLVQPHASSPAASNITHHTRKTSTLPIYKRNDHKQPDAPPASSRSEAHEWPSRQPSVNAISHVSLQAHKASHEHNKTGFENIPCGPKSLNSDATATHPDTRYKAAYRPTPSLPASYTRIQHPSAYLNPALSLLPNGKALTPIDPPVARRLLQLEEDVNKLRRQAEDKQKEKRAGLREWAVRERESRRDGLRSELAEAHLLSLSGGVIEAGAF